MFEIMISINYCNNNKGWNEMNNGCSKNHPE